MHDNDEIELTSEERNMLDALPREMKMGDLLEERVLRSLKKAGHFGGAASPRRSVGNIWKIAAAIALFAGGVATGGYLMSSKLPAATTAATARQQRDHAPPKDTTINRARRIAPATETLVAERELWM